MRAKWRPVIAEAHKTLSNAEQLKHMILKDVLQEEQDFQKRATSLSDCTDHKKEARPLPVEVNKETKIKENFMSYLPTVNRYKNCKLNNFSSITVG